MDLNKVIKDLKKGNNIEKNLSLYGNEMAKSYFNMASYMLAMNLTSNYDLIEEDDSIESDNVKALFKTVVEVIEKVIVEEDLSDLKECTERIRVVRDTIIKKTDALDDYTYVLQTYEHLLNRVEYRFKTYEPTTDLKTFQEDIMLYVSGGGSAEVINDRIRMIMGELPVRLTASKFLDMVGACGRYYKGVRNDIAGEFFERMKNCARLLSLDMLDSETTPLYEACRKVLALDVENITEQDYKNAVNVLSDASKYIVENLTSYLRLVDIVNNLLVMLLTVAYVPVFTRDMQKACAVIKEVISAQKKGTFLRPDEDIVGLLSALTDRQPVYQGEHMMLEDALYEILTQHKTDIESLYGELFKGLHTCLQLSGASVLSKTVEEAAYFSVDQLWINKKIIETEMHFKNVFETMGRPYRRAVMSVTLGCMPVVFDRLEDFADYISRSLEGCRDQDEREACISIIGDIIAGA